jgi:hypothetical protein
MEKTWKPTTAGVLNIISGVWGIAAGILIMVFSGFVGMMGASDWSGLMRQWGGGVEIPGFLSGIWGSLGTIALVVGILALVFGVIALVGGINALRRRRWGLALAGAILSLPLVPVGSVLGILAIIFLAMGKKEFS